MKGTNTMKYKITNTDLQLDNNLHSEGSVIELTKEQTKGIEDYLVPINNSRLSRRSPKDEAGKTKNKKGVKK